jgi:hypothetical protein
VAVAALSSNLKYYLPTRQEVAEFVEVCCASFSFMPFFCNTPGFEKLLD